MRRTGVHIVALILMGWAGLVHLSAQGVPSSPLSIPVYHPIVINPAFVGSKDYTNISITSRILGFDSQVINLHKRLNTSDGDFSNLGFGAYAFQEQYTNSWNTGLALAGSYHFALDAGHLHNLSGGASVKGIIAIPKSDSEVIPDSATAEFHPDLDLGIYYYGPSAFVGLSATSLFGEGEGDSLTTSYTSVASEYHLYGGYKFMISKSAGIVVEPSLLVSVDNETISELHKHLVPYLKVYLQNFYIGSYYKDLNTFALFFQYQFPKFYTGLFIEFPTDEFLTDKNMIFELSLGINMGKGGRSFLQYRHW